MSMLHQWHSKASDKYASLQKLCLDGFCWGKMSDILGNNGTRVQREIDRQVLLAVMHYVKRLFWFIFEKNASPFLVRKLQNIGKCLHFQAVRKHRVNWAEKMFSKMKHFICAKSGITRDIYIECTLCFGLHSAWRDVSFQITFWSVPILYFYPIYCSK